MWDTLGEKVKALTDNVVIAKMDATANDLPLGSGIKIHGFPTIKFFPADDKENPLDYDGERALEDFLAFLKSKSKFL